ncbi:hypothetical protein ACFQ0M_38475 [Kitasatospora aburaviensis]
MDQTFASAGTGPGIDVGKVAALADEVLDWRFKALPDAARG